MNIRRVLEEVTDLEGELEYITDVIREEDEGEFVFLTKISWSLFFFHDTGDADTK